MISPEGRGLTASLTPSDETLMDPILGKSWADKHSCSGFMEATAMSFPEDKQLPHISQAHLTIFLASSLWPSLSPGEGTTAVLAGQNSPPSLILSALTTVWSFSDEADAELLSNGKPEQRPEPSEHSLIALTLMLSEEQNR